jgi:hypothetical protein
LSFSNTTFQGPRLSSSSGLRCARGSIWVKLCVQMIEGTLEVIGGETVEAGRNNITNAYRGLSAMIRRVGVLIPTLDIIAETLVDLIAPE